MAEQCSAHTEAMERVSAAETEIESLFGRMKNSDKKFDNAFRWEPMGDAWHRSCSAGRRPWEFCNTL